MIMLLLLLSRKSFYLLTSASSEHPSDTKTEFILFSAAYDVSGTLLELISHPLTIISDVILDPAGLSHEQGWQCVNCGLIHIHEDLSAECLVSHRSQERSDIHLLCLSARRSSLLLGLL